MTPALNPPTIPIEHIDQRVRLHDIDWEGYESFLTLRGEQGGTRVTYLDGELELMSPSINHELLKKTLARLLETYAEERGIELNGYGSWTVKSAGTKRGVEADECYVVGLRDAPPEIPDIAIEVVWTSGGIDKLEVYRGLGVPEVWFWRNAYAAVFSAPGLGLPPRRQEPPPSRSRPRADRPVHGRIEPDPGGARLARGAPGIQSEQLISSLRRNGPSP